MRARNTVLAGLTILLLCSGAMLAQPLGTVEQELEKVRDAGRELYTRDSTVFGKLPSPAEMAAQQMRCRPAPKPDAQAKHEMDFDAAVKARAAKLDPKALAKLPGRMGMTILPVGITGAYVVEAMGRDELLVVHVLPDSPAAGVLEIDDIIIGANGRLFVDPEDPRPEMGNALCESQSPELGGILTLQIVRDHKPLNVKMDLHSTLDFGPTWPYDDEKTRQVRTAALKYVRETPRGRYNFWTPLFLMASGDDEALEMARRMLCSGLKKSYEENTGGSAWTGGYRLTQLSEYYLLTGDSAVLPLINHTAQGVSWAQYRSGSWSHGAGKGPNVTAPGMASGGYGEVNNAGLGALIGLCLSRQCGVVPYWHTIPRSIRFFGPFCGENLGYGLGTPNDSRTGRMDNGMSGMSAMVFHLLGEDEMAQRWARSTCYMWMGRERGHAEAIFSAAWGPVCAALAPSPEFHAFMNHMKWAYEMGRTRDGGLSFMRGSRWDYPNMTAAYGLFLYLPEKRLQILGGDSVFAHKPPKGLEEAARLYREKRWGDLDKFLDGALAKPVDDEHMWYATKLREAHQRLEKHAAATLKIIGRTIAEGDVKMAETQLDLLAEFVGAERPAAAALRAKLADMKPKSAGKRAKTNPMLIDAKKIMADLKLTKGGPRDGWADSDGYISRINEQGFAGMTPEQIAPFLGHFSGGVEHGAVLAIAQYGERALPILKRCLGDAHPGVRAGAVDAMRAIFSSPTDEPRTEIPEDLTGIIKLIRPMLDDKSRLVRASVGRFVTDLNVVNDDIYDMLEVLARQGSDVESFIRYKIKDPVVRTRLCMALVEGNNERRVTSPAAYKPIIYASSAHMAQCEPYVQTAIDTLNNPEVQVMYGFFSNSPAEAALHICARYYKNPLVLKNLPTMIRCAMTRGGCNSYWNAHKEFPHRIAILIGRDAIPVIEKHWASERKLFDDIQAGKVNRPKWWKPELPNKFGEECAEWQNTVELIRCLYGVKPADQAVAGMVRHYFKDRWWAAWERARIWDKLVEMGVPAVALIRKDAAEASTQALADADKAIAAKKAELSAEKDRGAKRTMQKKLDVLTAHRDSMAALAGEMVQLCNLIEALNAPKPTADAVKTMCDFYLRRPYGAQYPYVKDDGSLLRPLHAKQDELVRNTLARWGVPASTLVRAYLAEDAAKVLPELNKKLDVETAEWKDKRGGGGYVRRAADERRIDLDARQQLADVADVTDITDTKGPSDEQLVTLCRIYAQRDWPMQQRVILKTLKACGPRAAKAVARQAPDDEAILADAKTNIRRLMGDTAKGDSRTIPYDHYMEVAKTIRKGLAELRKL